MNDERDQHDTTTKENTDIEIPFDNDYLIKGRDELAGDTLQ